MPKYLLTQTLLGNFQYMMDCRDEVKDEAYEDFLKTLKREPRETTEAMQNGKDFEDLVYKIAHGWRPPTVPDGFVQAMGDTIVTEHIEYPKWWNGAYELAKFIKDAPDQIPLYGNATVHGLDVLVYGILDSLKAGVIYDVKFSNKSFGSADLVGKYLNSPQHPTYFFLCPEATDFVYLISDGEDIYTERYTRRMTRDFHEVAEEFFRFLETADLLETYKEKWDTDKCTWHGREE